MPIVTNEVPKLNVQEFVENVHKWSTDRKVIPNSTAQTQALYAQSEYGELAKSLAKKGDIRDDIGDVAVTLVNVWLLSGHSVEQVRGIIQRAVDGCTKNLHPQQSVLGLHLHLGSALSVPVGLWDSAHNAELISTLLYIAMAAGVDYQECFGIAWNDIKDRKGYIDENGVFIKEV